jgi:hypothetical protein
MTATVDHPTHPDFRIPEGRGTEKLVLCLRPGCTWTSRGHGYAGAHDAGTAHVERAHPAPSCSCAAEGRTRCAYVACGGRTA